MCEKVAKWYPNAGELSFLATWGEDDKFLNILFLHVHPRTKARETFQRRERALMGLQELINYGKSIGIVELSLKAAKCDVYAQLRR